MLTSTDARGLTTTFTYDSANRLTEAAFADGQRIVYRYDTATHGVGRLAQIADVTGSLSWNYDALGRVTTRRQRTAGLDLSTVYTYDDKGRLATMTYPSGRQVSYAYDQLGRIGGISVDAQPVVTQVRYHPFGRASGWNWGNGTSYARKFDQDGRLVEFPLGSEIRTLTYDAADRILAFSDPGQRQDFDYDVLNRLTGYQSGATQIEYDYDANGNRLHLTENAGETAYTYGDSDNRLIGRSGSQATTYHYDAAGNLLDDGQRQFTYDARGRMTRVSSTSGTTRYGINGLGQRVYKTGTGVPTGTLRFVYDEAGQLIGEYDKTGNVIQETIWFENAPLAVLSKGQVYNVFADQLGTPRLITNISNGTVWSWDGDPFGNGSSSGSLTYNLRFPGQYYDKESGFHYNYFRDYDPVHGRYVQGDPIGLASGSSNPYSYVSGEPIGAIDPLGLERVTLYIRSFAPFKEFGFGFAGDNRSFSTSLSASSRITGKVIIDTSTGKIVGQPLAWSSPSYHPQLGTKTGSPQISARACGGGRFQVSIAGANPLLPFAPKIDVKLQLKVIDNEAGPSFSGRLSGDAFPNAEVFVIRGSGAKEMLHTFSTSGPPNIGPLDLLFNNDRPMGVF